MANIKVLNKEYTSSVFYDKDRNIYAEDKNIVNCEFSYNDKCNENSYNRISIISGLLFNIHDNEQSILNCYFKQYFNSNNKIVNINDIINECSNQYNKSNITYKRALEKLIKRNIFNYKNNFKYIELNDDYNIIKDRNINDINYIIVKIQH